MPLYLRFILAFTQGLTEFLPISSQGHLIIVNKFFSYEYESVLSTLEINIYAHFGSLMAVSLIYNKQLLSFMKSLKMVIRPDLDSDAFLLNHIIIATLPIILIGFFFAKSFDYEQESILLIIGLTSIIFGLLIFFIDKFCLRIKNENALTVQLSFTIGLFQCFALCPGVSRSGALLTIMRFLGFRREFSVLFSNLLSIPVILGAVCYLVVKNFNSLSFHNIISFDAILLIILSFIFSLFFIFFFINWVKKFSLSIFAYYRIILGALLLVYFYK